MAIEVLAFLCEKQSIEYVRAAVATHSCDEGGLNLLDGGWYGECAPPTAKEQMAQELKERGLEEFGTQH